MAMNLNELELFSHEEIYNTLKPHKYNNKLIYL